MRRKRLLRNLLPSGNPEVILEEARFACVYFYGGDWRVDGGEEYRMLNRVISNIEGWTEGASLGAVPVRNWG